MNDFDIEVALSERIAAAPIAGLALLFQNLQQQAGPLPLPYAVIDVVFDTNSDRTLAAEQREATGRVMVTVVCAGNTGLTQASPFCDQLRGVFPMGRRISIMGGTIEIPAHPNRKRAFPQGGNWRTVLEIPFRATQT